ncbi:aminotransferase class V-fold PLP-dependent enzyme [Pseudorhodoferax soli]|nr:aminotransferase class V-fold PLP-dependent enzyme [Pseudorhodoferax soli]
MEIYLDANATTPVLAQARSAALAAMSDLFGNPSSTHGAGLAARALLDGVRASARRVLGVPGGRLMFTSGATEGIQTAVLSALHALRERRDAGQAVAPLLLYGATEHKAVPEAIRHWNALLGLDLRVQAIPVGTDGLHDLGWLRGHAAQAGLVCTMAANNETGAVSDLDGIAAALAGGPALWLVDGVQALGKLDLRLAERRIDYAPFSGHKLYAPKGVGMLYVREGAPFTPLQAGGGQEQGQRAGTENMAGIAALGAVLQALEQGGVFADHATLQAHRAQLADALRGAFPGVVFNAPFDTSLPTTLNVAVPGVAAQDLIALFDAAGVRVSGGSACGAARAEPSYVLQAMGLPDWQAASAVRLSFGAADSAAFVQEACARLRACGEALRDGRVLDDAARAALEMDAAAVRQALQAAARPLVVDVREADERSQQPVAGLATEQVPLSALGDALARWRALPAATQVIFVCRSGRRSAQAADALRRQGHANAWSLAGGLAQWAPA